jgi:hypothetical protein
LIWAFPLNSFAGGKVLFSVDSTSMLSFDIRDMSSFQSVLEMLCAIITPAGISSTQTGLSLQAHYIRNGSCKKHLYYTYFLL